MEGVDLNELLKAIMGRGLATMANGFEQDARILNNVAVNKFGSTDLIEAAAAKELSKAGQAGDFAGYNAATRTPTAAVPPK